MRDRMDQNIGRRAAAVDSHTRRSVAGCRAPVTAIRSVVDAGGARAISTEDAPAAIAALSGLTGKSVAVNVDRDAPSVGFDITGGVRARFHGQLDRPTIG